MKNLFALTLIVTISFIILSCSGGSSTPKEALLNYHYGVKEGNRERLKKALREDISDFYIDLTMSQNTKYPYNFDIEWVRDSVVNENKVVVFFRVKEEGYPLIGNKAFIKENGNWVREKI